MFFLFFIFIGLISSRKLSNSITSFFKKFSNVRILLKPLTILITFAMFAIVVYLLKDIGFNNISNNYILREKLSSLGPFVIFLQIPLGASVYFWSRNFELKTKRSFYNALLFTVLALVTAFIRGQRTDIILIFLLPTIVYYSIKKRILPIIFSAIVAMVFSVLYATLFKASFMASGTNSFLDSLQRVVSGDLDRNWTLWMTVEKSDFISSSILPYMGSGYLYTIFAYVPRSIVPFKRSFGRKLVYDGNRATSRYTDRNELY